MPFDELIKQLQEKTAETLAMGGPEKLAKRKAEGHLNARERIVTVAMSYRARPPLLDYVVIGDETTLVYADNALRDGTGVLVPPQAGELSEDGSIDRQDASFFAWILTGVEPATSARRVRPTMAALQAAQDELDRLAQKSPQAT